MKKYGGQEKSKKKSRNHRTLLYCIKSAIIICLEKQTLILLENREFYESKVVCTLNLPDIFVNLEQSSGLDCTVQDASYNKDGYFPSEI